MMEKTIEELIREYVKNGRMMQIATANGDQPWSCIVYYASDTDLNLYWISKPDTRHSREIQINSKVAGSIPIKFDDLIVVGVQLEGDAKLVDDNSEIKEKVKLYSDKFNRGNSWCEDFIAGKNEHKLYRIKPRLFVIFDRVNFPEDSRKEWRP